MSVSRCESRTADLPSADGGIRWSSQSSTGELVLVVWVRKSQHRPAVLPEAQIQGSEMARSKIYIICKQWRHMKGQSLLIQRCRISMTLCNKRVTGRMWVCVLLLCWAG